MALAKAFPDTYQYELNEPTSVSVVCYIYSSHLQFCGMISDEVRLDSYVKNGSD